MTALNTCVLVADDEPTIATIIQRTIKQMGLTAVIVSNGEQAILAARTLDTQLACAIFDTMMPVMGGIDAAIAIHAFAPELPIILMSASNYLALSERAALMLHVSFMEKPFRLEYLQFLLNQVLHEKEPAA